MNCYFCNQYAYFSVGIDEQLPGPLLYELNINLFVDSDHVHDKVAGILITGLFIMVVSTPKTWSSKRQTTVLTSTFGAEFTALNKVNKESIMTGITLNHRGSRSLNIHL